MKRQLFILIILITTGVFSCEKIPITPEEPVDTDQRAKFVGKYNVYRPEFDDYYEMEIKKIGQQCNNCDSIQIINFCNLFPEIRKLYQQLAVGYENYFQHLIFGNISDNQNRRWVLSSAQNNSTPYQENVLRSGDTIYFGVSLNNIQYYFEDGVPYMDTVLFHRAVKIQ